MKTKQRTRCACGADRKLIKPSAINGFKKARWMCVARGCPLKRRKFIPNSELPKEAKLLSRTKTTAIGGWSSMMLDATLTRNGIRWLRVKGGFSGRGDREDWIADLPSSCCSVADYNWNDLDCGTNYGTFEKALDGKLEIHLSYLRQELKESSVKVHKLQVAIHTVLAALK